MTANMLRVLSQDDVERQLPMAACIEAIARVFVMPAVLPLRQAVWMPDRRGMIGLMPGFADATLGLKVVSIFPGNHEPGSRHDSHQGVVMLFDTEHGTPLAVIDASSITAIRTAAASAVATRALARDDAGDLAILGAGVQAASHLEAMAAVRTLRRIRVWSRTRASAERFATRDPRIEVMATPRDAVTGADLVCTVTAAKEPILEGAWLAAGAHVNAVGACFASSRELDTAAVLRARTFVDRRESALAESGDLLFAARESNAAAEGLIAAELADVLAGRVPGRRAPDEITLYESLGIAVFDLAAARLVLARATAAGAGAVVPLGRARS